MNDTAKLFAGLLLGTTMCGGVTPPANAQNAATISIYSGGLQPGWSDWSWVPHKIAETDISHSGTTAAAIDFGKSGGFYLHHDPFAAPPNAALAFFVDGGATGGQQFNVHAIVGPKGSAAQPMLNVTDFIPGGHIPANTWIEVSIPLDKLGAADATNLTGFWLQDSYYNPQPTLYVDDISLQPVGTPLAAPAPAKPAPPSDIAAPTAKAEDDGPVVVQDPSPADLALLPKRTHPAYIMLKLDDLEEWNGNIRPGWQRVVDFLKERHLKANIGIISNALRGNPKFVQWIKDQQATGLIEFWNHGFDHRQWQMDGKTVEEFKDDGYDLQKAHMTQCEQLSHDELGAAYDTFGAPFNATDADTVKVLQEDPNIKIWLYGDAQDPAGKIVLDRVDAANIEQPTFEPNYRLFVKGYAANPDRDFFVIQGHPWSWTHPGRWENFVKIIDFLTTQGAIFTTPTEYCQLKHLLPAQ